MRRFSGFCRLLAIDTEYSLFGVVIFKRVRDEFVQKCRENKYVQSHAPITAESLTAFLRFIVRDFVYSDDQQLKQQEELDLADTTEKELWVNSNATN
jgi:V-type H+-transporting ATPase subunit C